MTVTVADLCGRGFLPKELPPCFSAASFAPYAASLKPSKLEGTWTEGTVFNLARPGGLRRRITIPHPISYVALARSLAAGWSNVEAVYKKSPFTNTAPQVGTGRALEPSFWFPERTAERAKLRRMARFVLIGDLSQCYSSMYTHSFAWALAGKESAKAALKTKTPMPGDDLDVAARNLQLGQTKGVPIGPDTSLALAELILASVDVEMARRMHGSPSTLPALRITDDLEYYATSRSEAEDALLAWEGAAATYELQVNPAKTQIVELPTSLVDHWSIELRQFRIRDAGTALANDLADYFSVVHDLASQHRWQPVIGYAIARANGIDGIFADQATWDHYLDLLLLSSIVEPAVLNRLFAALSRAAAAGLKIDVEGAAATLNEIVRYHAPLEHGAEVSWALYIMHVYGIPLLTPNANAVALMGDNVSLLLLQSLISNAAVSQSEVDWSEAAARAEALDAAGTSDWLLAYEAAVAGWTDPTHIAGDALLGPMYNAGVKFLRLAPSPSRSRVPQSAVKEAEAPIVESVETPAESADKPPEAVVAEPDSGQGFGVDPPREDGTRGAASNPSDTELAGAIDWEALMNLADQWTSGLD